jgi:hypothetical protein
MVRVREARRAFRRFRTTCFWSCRPDLVIEAKDVPWVAEQLMKHGSREARRVGARLCPQAASFGTEWPGPALTRRFSPTERDAMPGADRVKQGLRDLGQEAVTVESLLVSIGAPALRRLGFVVSRPHGEAELRLYHLLTARHGAGAHARYNALVRELVSFQRAVACVT